jgi:hypothetical protein
VERSGNVVRKQVAEGSKSERTAILLQTDEGEYVLRIQGGNPFHDQRLEQLVGKRIRARGQIHGYSFLMDDWVEA